MQCRQTIFLVLCELFLLNEFEMSYFLDRIAFMSACMSILYHSADFSSSQKAQFANLLCFRAFLFFIRSSSFAQSAPKTVVDYYLISRILDKSGHPRLVSEKCANENVFLCVAFCHSPIQVDV